MNIMKTIPINKVSVVVPAYNSEKTIARTIDAIKRQTFRGEVELIVVDDGSVDQTASIIKKFSNVKYIFQNNAGPATARNKGVKESTADFVFFTDADCIPSDNWIEKMIRHFDDSGVGIVCGSYDIVNSKSLLAQCIHKEIIFRHFMLMPSYPKSFGSYNFCARKKVFESAGGFDESYRWASGEDNDLSYKILKKGWKIYFAKESKVSHHFPESIMQYLREQFQHGFWRVKMYKDHPAMSGGDDYTFWKDIAEPGLVILCLLNIPLLVVNVRFFFFALIAVLTGLIFLEFFFSLFMTRSILKGVFYCGVMFLRAFMRTFGFIKGISSFLTRKSLK